MKRLDGRSIPETLVSQHLARVYPGVVNGKVARDPRALCLAAVNVALDPYYTAINGTA